MVLLTIALCGCGNRTEKALQKGITKISKEDYKTAIRILEDEVMKNPENASIQCNLGLAYWKSGKLNDAISTLRIAEELTDTAPEPLEFIGQIYVEKNKFDEAQKAFKLAAERDPSSARVLTSLAVVEYYRGEFYNCEQYLKKAIKVDPDYAPALFNLAIMYRSRIGGKSKAKFYFSHYIKIASNGPRKDIANNFISSCKESEHVSPKEQSSQKTKPVITTAVAKKPITKVRPQQPATILKEINRKLQDKKIDEALIMLDKSVMQYPNSADLLWLQATQYYMLANEEKAKNLYEIFTNKFPADHRTNLIPKFKTAIPPSKEKSIAKKESPKPQNQSRGALASYAFRKANSLYDNGRYDEAMISYEKALKYDPDMTKALYTLGHIYNRKKEYKQAAIYFEKTLEQNHDLIEARYMLAIANYELKNNVKAKEELETAVEMDPFYSKALFMLGLINRKENNSDKAKLYLKRFLSIDPTSQQAVKAKQWLAAYGE